MPLIEIINLSKLYRMGDSVVRALDGVDLTIDQGEFVAITGPSGSGKSTMMHLLGCLDRPTTGTYRLNGIDVSDMSDRELAITRNRQIGFVFQTFNLINRTSALDNVAVPLFYARRLDTHGPARAALERVNLLRRGHHRPSELSGGERQRVAIARAIVNDPPLLLADEPTGNLDTRTGEQIMEIFHALNRQGVTIVLVTHEHDVAIQARRIIQMRDGKVILDKPTAEVVAGEFLLRPVTAGRGAAAATDDGVANGQPSADAGRANGRPAEEAEAADPSAQSQALPGQALPGRTMRGATGAAITSLIGAAALLGCLVLGWLTDWRSLAAQRGATVPSGELAKLGVASLLFLLAWLIGLVGIFRGRGVLRRMHAEPANWRGRKRAGLAIAIGLVLVLLPVGFVLFRLIT